MAKGRVESLLQIKRQMVALIDECPRANESLIRLESNRRVWLIWLPFSISIRYLSSIFSELAGHLRRS